MALDFLADRNPLTDKIDTRVEWVCRLMDYQEHKGEKALQAMAGFYCWMLDNKEGDKRTQGIRTTIAHDIYGMRDKWCEPRSMPYLEFWEQECEKRGWLDKLKQA